MVPFRLASSKVAWVIFSRKAIVVPIPQINFPRDLFSSRVCSSLLRMVAFCFFRVTISAFRRSRFTQVCPWHRSRCLTLCMCLLSLLAQLQIHLRITTSFPVEPYHCYSCSCAMPHLYVNGNYLDTTWEIKKCITTLSGL